MPKTCIDYSKCIIYKIVCHDYNVKDLYVGHTTDLVKRRAIHKYACNNASHKSHNLKIYLTIRDNGGWENWSIIVVEKYDDCKDAEGARTRERFWFEQLNATLNSIKPLSTSDEKHNYYKEYLKQYREVNKEKTKEYNLTYMKDYYIKNKDKIIKQQKEYLTHKKMDQEKEAYMYYI
jgi:hypothetical protein